MLRACKWWLVAAGLCAPLAVYAAEPPSAAPPKEPPAATHPVETDPADTRPEKPAAEAKSDDTKDESLIGGKRSPDQRADDEYFDLYRSLADTLDQIERNYVKPIDRRELMEAAIKGVISKLDPYSSYISPDELSGFRNTVESQFGGIGIQVTIDDGQLKVTSPLVGTPAYRAGVQAGDKIVKIEGEPTAKITLDEATKKLKGEVGSSVTFTVQHPGSGKSDTFTIRREIIHVDTVLGDKRKPDDSWDFMLDPEKRIGYIRVTAFSRDTASDLRKALEDLKARKMRGLILDLRFNPGGLLTSAVEVANLFVDEGRIVSTKGRNTSERVWDAVKGNAFEGFPVVVLVNHYSASASEIVSACLQDHHRAAILGDRTWGKGSVQNVIELESGKSALKLTTSSYTRPNGHKIHRFPDDKDTDEWGVTPDKGLDLALGTGEMAELLAYRRQRDVVEGKHPADELASAATEKGDPKPEVNAPINKPSATGKSKTGAAKPDKAKPAESSTGSQHEKKSAPSDVPPQFVDRQLQKAVEYLNSELARAP